jgi:site-specific DNA-methyltransferase (adenine-specific)
MQKSLFENEKMTEELQPALQQCSVSRCNLWNGDCLELMSQIPDGSIDMIFADLPYGTTNCDWDVRIPFEPLWEHWNKISKENAAIILTGQQPFTTDIINSNRKYFRYEIIWEKTVKMGFLDANRKPLRGHENVVVFYRKQPVYNPQKYFKGVDAFFEKRKQTKNRYDGFGKHSDSVYVDDGWRFPHSVIKISNHNGGGLKNTEKTKHKTQKPVELLDWLIKTYTNEGDTVLDCVMGSGTTAVSCKKNNRHFIGIEKQKIFYDVAVSRVSPCSG